MIETVEPRSIEEIRIALSLALEAEDFELLKQTLDDLHPAELADVLEALPAAIRPSVWEHVEPKAKGDVLVEARREVREQLIAETGADELVSALERIDLDELADIHHALPETVIDAVLDAMDAQRRHRFEAVRSYPHDTAGGLMNTDAVAVRADVTLDVVMRFLRRLRKARGGTLPEHTDALMVVTRDNRYLGSLHMSELVSCESDATVAEVMTSDDEGIVASTPASAVARTFRDRDLISAAVLDDEGGLLGRITVDDVLDVMHARTERASLSHAGLPAGVDLLGPILPTAWRRTLWLGVHLAGGFVAAAVIGRFGSSIEQLVALAILMPIVAAAGGVAGNQTQALVTRGLALEQIGRGNAGRLLRKELGVSLANGLVWAILVGIGVYLWFGNVLLAAVFGLALLLSLVTAALAGTTVPLILNRIGLATLLIL